MAVAARIRRLWRFDALALTALLWFLGKFVRYVFPPLFDPLQTTYGVSNASLGTAFRGLMLAYALMQFPSGILADRIGSVRVITAGALLAAAFAYQVPKRIPETPVEDPSAAETDDSAMGEYMSLFRNWKFTTFVVVAVLFSFAYNGVIAFLPLYLADEAGLSAATAGLLYGALFATSPVQLLTGEVSDRIGTLPVMTASLGLAVLAIAALITVTGFGEPLLLGVTVVCLGLGGNGFRPVRGAYLVSVLPDSVAGGGLGIVRTLLMAAGALAPAVTGYLSEIAGFRTAFWLLASALIGAVVAAFVLWVDDR